MLEAANDSKPGVYQIRRVTSHKEGWWAKRAAISLVPVPSIDGFQGLNAHWQQRCLERMDDRLRGQSESFSQRMELGLEALLPLPDAPYDPCDQQAGRVSSLCRRPTDTGRC